jgi:hypothetical protein
LLLPSSAVIAINHFKVQQIQNDERINYQSQLQSVIAQYEVNTEVSQQLVLNNVKIRAEFETEKNNLITKFQLQIQEIDKSYQEKITELQQQHEMTDAAMKNDWNEQAERHRDIQQQYEERLSSLSECNQALIQQREGQSAEHSRQLENLINRISFLELQQRHEKEGLFMHENDLLSAYERHNHNTFNKYVSMKKQLQSLEKEKIETTTLLNCQIDELRLTHQQEKEKLQLEHGNNCSETSLQYEAMIENLSKLNMELKLQLQIEIQRVESNYTVEIDKMKQYYELCQMKLVDDYSVHLKDLEEQLRHALGAAKVAIVYQNSQIEKQFCQKLKESQEKIQQQYARQFSEQQETNIREELKRALGANKIAILYQISQNEKKLCQNLNETEVILQQQYERQLTQQREANHVLEQQLNQLREEYDKHYLVKITSLTDERTQLQQTYEERYEKLRQEMDQQQQQVISKYEDERQKLIHDCNLIQNYLVISISHLLWYV